MDIVKIKMDEKTYRSSLEYVFSYFNTDSLGKYQKLNWLTFKSFYFIMDNLPLYALKVSNNIITFISPSIIDDYRDIVIDLWVCNDFDNNSYYINYEIEDEYKDLWEEFDESQKNYFTVQAFLLLEIIERKFRKDKKRIKRSMPTPEEKENIEQSNSYYESAPIYIKDCIIQYIYEPHKSRKNKRHCGAWEVRGFWRHYKNGKEVFIKPHIRGKGVLKDTTYIITE
jgi:hypothetical protein